MTIRPTGTRRLDDVLLARAGSIAGVVTTQRPSDFVGISVMDAVSGESVGGAVSNASGAYRVSGLRTGRYKVRAVPVTVAVAAKPSSCLDAVYLPSVGKQ